MYIRIPFVMPQHYLFSKVILDERVKGTNETTSRAQATSKVPIIQKASKRKSPPKFHFPSQQLHTKYLEDTADKSELPPYKISQISMKEQSDTLVRNFVNEVQWNRSSDADVANDASKPLSNRSTAEVRLLLF